jgi:hypothetical protein
MYNTIYLCHKSPKVTIKIQKLKGVLQYRISEIQYSRFYRLASLYLFIYCKYKYNPSGGNLLLQSLNFNCTEFKRL